MMMDIRNPQLLKCHAQEALDAASYSPRKLFFLHTAVALGITALMALSDLLLAHFIADTGGLAGIQTRAILSTIQSVLQLAGSVALPFWQIGLLFGCLQLVRRVPARPRDLTEGFRRFVPVLRLLLTEGLIWIAVCIACSYAGSMLFILTPLSQGFMEQLAPIAESGDMAALEAFLYDEAALQQLLPSLAGFAVVLFILICAVCIPLAYRMRMTNYIVMDKPFHGAFAAIRESFRLTKGSCLALLRLDLSFWWYYLLDGIILLLYNLDWLLPSLGVQLPLSQDAAFWLCYGVYILLQLALITLAGPKVQTTYAATYEALQTE